MRHRFLVTCDFRNLGLDFCEVEVGSLAHQLQGVLEHGPSVAQNQDGDVRFHFAVRVLEVKRDLLVFDELADCFQIVDAFLFEFSDFHTGLVNQ